MQQIARTAAQTKKIPFTKNKRTCPPLGNSTALKCCMVLHESSGTRQFFERDNASFIYIYYIILYICMYVSLYGSDMFSRLFTLFDSFERILFQNST
jgi:hypothetical protein